MTIISIEEISEAQRGISGVTRRTPLSHSEFQGQTAGLCISFEQPRDSLKLPCRS
jgi:hypothetical protein